MRWRRMGGLIRRTAAGAAMACVPDLLEGANLLRELDRIATEKGTTEQGTMRMLSRRSLAKRALGSLCALMLGRAGAAAVSKSDPLFDAVSLNDLHLPNRMVM